MLLLIVALWKELMPRKKKIQKIKPDFRMECNHCDINVDPTGPMSGLIYQVGPKLLVICCHCATQLAQMQNIIQIRWG
jgi:hypothetical protein